MISAPVLAPDAATLRRPAVVRTLWLLAGVGVILVLVVLSVSFGVRAVTLDDILAALSGQSDTLAQAAVVKRIPRTVRWVTTLSRRPISQLSNEEPA